MSREVMAECLEEAIRLLEPYCASQSQVVLVHLDVIATLAVAIYRERMRHAVPVVSHAELEPPSYQPATTTWARHEGRTEGIDGPAGY